MSIREEIEKKIESFNPNPKIVEALSKIIKDTSTAPISKIAELLKLDQKLTYEILKESRLVKYGYTSQTTSTKKAGSDFVAKGMMRMGLNTVQTIIMINYMNSVVGTGNLGAYKFSEKTFWQKSIICGYVLEHLYEKIERKREMLYFLGLLHDVGVIILSNFTPSHINLMSLSIQSNKDIIQIEKDIFDGLSHPEVGAMLFQKIPDVSQKHIEAVKIHHDRERCENNVYAKLLYASCLIASNYADTRAKNSQDELIKALESLLNMEEKEIRAVLRSVWDNTDLREVLQTKWFDSTGEMSADLPAKGFKVAYQEYYTKADAKIPQERCRETMLNAMFSTVKNLTLREVKTTSTQSILDDVKAAEDMRIIHSNSEMEPWVSLGNRICLKIRPKVFTLEELEHILSVLSEDKIIDALILVSFDENYEKDKRLELLLSHAISISKPIVVIEKSDIDTVYNDKATFNDVIHSNYYRYIFKKFDPDLQTELKVKKSIKICRECNGETFIISPITKEVEECKFCGGKGVIH